MTSVTRGCAVLSVGLRNYKDESVNGVAVSVDPAYGRADSFYYNSQVGEDLVTNPDAYSVPEEVLSHNDGTYTVVALSNQAPPGQLLMTEAQMNQLAGHLRTIHDRFAVLYGVTAGEEFAIEIEYKITSANILAIKQARPWVFNSATFTSTSHSTVTDNPLTATFESDPQHSGIPFSVLVQFSDNVTVGFTGFRDHGVVVTGGSASNASRKLTIDELSKRDDLWKIDVIPNSTSTVRLYLVANRPCTLPGALCAFDGRRLSTPVKHIVPGTGPNTAPTFLTPLFAGGASGFSVPENSFGNTVVGRVLAINAENDPLSYTLAVSGVTTNPPFEIHAETGSIRVVVGARLDHAQRQTYSVTVTASDDLGGSTATTFDITIEDVNEAPVFQSSTARRYVPEDAAAGDPVGLAVTATDPDSGDTVRYELDPPESDLFTIDGANGQILVKEARLLDHETAPSHTVTVKALDSSNASDTVQVTIEVTDVNEPPDAVADAPDSFDEDSEITIDVLANDSDPEDDRSELLLTVFNSGPNAPRNGTVRVNEPANAGENRTITYEPNANYNGSDTFTYRVRDTGSPSLSSTTSVTIEVDAVNDAPTFASQTTTRSVSEARRLATTSARP